MTICSATAQTIYYKQGRQWPLKKAAKYWSWFWSLLWQNKSCLPVQRCKFLRFCHSGTCYACIRKNHESVLSYVTHKSSQTESPHYTIITRAAMLRGFQYVCRLLAAIGMQRAVCRPGCTRKGKRLMRKDTTRIENVSTFCQRKEHRDRNEKSSITGDMELSSKAMLTHWGPDKMIVIFKTIFSNAFSWMKMYGFRLWFHWTLFPMVQLTISYHWFR